MTEQEVQHIFHRACLRKANLSEETANEIINKALAREHKLLYYYKCQFCDSYHLTSREPNLVYQNLEVI